MKLAEEEKILLLKIARKSIETEFDLTTEIPPVDFKKYPELMVNGGAFVTLTIDDRLRGCIGYIVSDLSLPETVKDAAKQAAFGDPRFPSLTRNELELINIEVSVLSKPFPAKDYEEIELGKHGLILDEGGRRGLLLPQVPIEHNMTREEFLAAICKKAGFHETLWKEKKLDLHLFTANVFSEKELEVNNED